jgi:hypothetical protein
MEDHPVSSRPFAVPVVPDPLESFEAWQRYRHADLSGLSNRALLVELWQAQLGLALLDARRPADELEREWEWYWERWETVTRHLRAAPR